MGGGMSRFCSIHWLEIKMLHAGTKYILFSIPEKKKDLFAFIISKVQFQFQAENFSSQRRTHFFNVFCKFSQFHNFNQIVYWKF